MSAIRARAHARVLMGALPQFHARHSWRKYDPARKEALPCNEWVGRRHDQAPTDFEEATEKDSKRATRDGSVAFPLLSLFCGKRERSLGLGLWALMGTALSNYLIE